MINLKRCIVFEAALQTFVKKMNTWKSIIFHENTALIVQQNIQNTHTIWNAHIELHKIHLAYQAHESTHTMKCT